MGARNKGTTEAKRVGVARVERGNGNVFEDLSLPDARALLAKSELVSRISGIIEKRGLTEGQAANILGVSPPSISAILRGNLDRFSAGRLCRFLDALGRPRGHDGTGSLILPRA